MLELSNPSCKTKQLVESTEGDGGEIYRFQTTSGDYMGNLPYFLIYLFPSPSPESTRAGPFQDLDCVGEYLAVKEHTVK